MLSRLPIFLAQLNPGIIQENLKMKEDNYCIVQKKLNKSTYKHLVSIISIWDQSLWKLKIVKQMDLTIFFINLLTSLNLKNQIKILY